MSQAPPALQRFRFSDALRDCFEPVFANFLTLAMLALLIVPLAALRRSRRLSEGSRWAIFWVMLLMAVLSGVVSAIVALPASLLLGVTVATMGGPGPFWPLIALLQAVGASAGALLYAAARRRCTEPCAAPRKGRLPPTWRRCSTERPGRRGGLSLGSRSFRRRRPGRPASPRCAAAGCTWPCGRSATASRS